MSHASLSKVAQLQENVRGHPHDTVAVIGTVEGPAFLRIEREITEQAEPGRILSERRRRSGGV
ncbi:MAG: hypothetical protein H3C62_02415 [Gemmatimonadaceae bacterium]|nr:hypothetical protein [Gemmatimonadaceae bacterium]